MSVTIEDVHAAADKLNMEGTRPTYVAIRALLGKASFTTIAEGLKTWTPKAAEAGPSEPVPDDIMQSAASFTTRIWDTAIALASQRADEKLIQLRSELDYTAADLQSVVATADASAAENEQLRKEVETLKGSVAKYRTTLSGRDRELAAAKAEAETLRRTVDQFAAAMAINQTGVVPAS